MPAAFWYDDFMPQLLAACSVSTSCDVAEATVPDPDALREWFVTAREAGEFASYGADVAEHFLSCDPAQQLAIQQAWRLTRHYLNGVQKRRERAELGRESGHLSEYVAFLDVWLGRDDVARAQMRVSFPYYIGPAAWRFLHTSAEVICARPAKEQARLLIVFKDFFRYFVTMYACPYCRYHLTNYVIRNREVDLYPLEYLLEGGEVSDDTLVMSMNDKLAKVTDGPSLRLFLWKLHNAVSASIERTESWYHQDEDAFYTTRYWPGLGGELSRVRALGHDAIPVERVERIQRLLKPLSRLSALRHVFQDHLRTGHAGHRDVPTEAGQAIERLEAAIKEGAFLTRAYHLNHSLGEEAPHFTAEEEAFGRSGIFVEV